MERKRKYYADNREARRERDRKYRAANPEASMLCKRRRRENATYLALLLSGIG